MRLVFLCGPPCAGKTTLAWELAQADDVVLDYDDIARNLGSPAMWLHPEPWRTAAEQDMQAWIEQAYLHPSTGLAWVVRTAPRSEQRAQLARQWQAAVYVVDPGERECRARAKAQGRPQGTSHSIGTWYSLYRPWSGDRHPSTLDGSDTTLIMVEPESI